MTRAIAFLAATLCAAPAVAATIQAGPNDDVESMINALQPGDELVLADGDYTLSGRFGVNVSGTSAAPILIRAADNARPHFHRPEANQNIWDLTVSWVTIRGLAFSGGSAGLRVEAADNFTIEDCEVFETADVALRFNDGGQNYANITIQRNHIHDTHGTGEGMYLGCNNNGCQMSNSLIAHNYVHNMDADDILQGDGIELKEGSYGNTIRDNVIHDTNYPCILTYSTVGNGAPNVIEGNVMWNCADNAIQSAADAVIRNNIILGAGGNGIASQPHQNGAPSNMTIVHNTIINGGTAIAVRNAVGTVTVANNAVYSQNGSAIQVVGTLNGFDIVGNVGNGGLNGPNSGLVQGDIAADFEDAMYGQFPMDVFPGSGGALPGVGDAAHVPEFDFNGTMRNGRPDVGAYHFAAMNPGWTITEDFKGESSTTPGEDMGTADDMGMANNAPGDMGNNGASDLGNNAPGNNTPGNNDPVNNPPGNNGPGNNSPGSDAGEGGLTGGEEGGCCATHGPGPRDVSWLLLFAGLVGLGRARRRRSAQQHLVKDRPRDSQCPRSSTGQRAPKGS